MRFLLFTFTINKNFSPNINLTGLFKIGIKPILGYINSYKGSTPSVTYGK